MATCPRCDREMRSHLITTDVEKWEVEVDACTEGCGGIWLQQWDFEADGKAKLLHDSEVLELNRRKKPYEESGRPLMCPDGCGRMSAYQWAGTDLELNHCPKCRGRWFDGGEVGTMKAALGR